MLNCFLNPFHGKNPFASSLLSHSLLSLLEKINSCVLIAFYIYPVRNIMYTFVWCTEWKHRSASCASTYTQYVYRFHNANNRIKSMLMMKQWSFLLCYCWKYIDCTLLLLVFGFRNNGMLHKWMSELFKLVQHRINPSNERVTIT